MTCGGIVCRGDFFLQFWSRGTVVVGVRREGIPVLWSTVREINYTFTASSVLWFWFHVVAIPTGIDEDDSVPESSDDAPSTEDMPPLEGDEDDASRMEEVD